MRIENEIYFAPGIKFKDLNWNDPKYLIWAFHQRVDGFYLRQANLFIETWNERINVVREREELSGLAFGCGVICSTAIDFLAGIEFFPSQDIGDRNKKWLNRWVSPFQDTDPQNPRQSISARFYYEFRNGLIHEGRIKHAGQFSFDSELFTHNGLYEIVDEAMVVNPGALLNSIASGLDNYLRESLDDELLLQKFRCTLIQVFSSDVDHIRKHG